MRPACTTANQIPRLVLAALLVVLGLRSLAAAEGCPLTERVRAGRERLTDLAREESLAHPEDADALLRWMSLRGDFEVPEGTDLPEGAALAQVACESAFDDVARGASLDQAAALAEERIGALERQLPGSSLVPLYRLRLTLLTCRRQPDFYVAATGLIEEALKRDDFQTPHLRWTLLQDEWLERNEPDLLVRAILAPALPAKPWVGLRGLQKIAEGASLAPGPLDSDLVALVVALRGLLDDRWRRAVDSMESVAAHVILARLIETSALLQWRARDLDGLRASVSAMDEWIRNEKSKDAWFEEYKEAHEAELWLMNETFQRNLMPLADLKKLRETTEDGIIDAERSLRDAASGKSRDSELLEEWYARIEGAAAEILRSRREEIVRTTPYLEEYTHFTPKEDRQLVNGLTRLLDDESFLASAEFPPERLEEMLDLVFDPNARLDLSLEVRGHYAYEWAVLDALYRAESVPLDRVRARLEGQWPRRAEILTFLHARGEDVDEGDLIAALVKVQSQGYYPEMHGYCRLLAARVRDGSSAALPLVTEPGSGPPEYAEAMIAETLAVATGQPFGLDLTRWREWLASRK